MRAQESHKWRGTNSSFKTKYLGTACITVHQVSGNPPDLEPAPANPEGQRAQGMQHNLQDTSRARQAVLATLPSSHHPGQEGHTNTFTPPLQLQSWFLKASVLSSSSIPFEARSFVYLLHSLWSALTSGDYKTAHRLSESVGKKKGARQS